MPLLEGSPCHKTQFSRKRTNTLWQLGRLQAQTKSSHQMWVPILGTTITVMPRDFPPLCSTLPAHLQQQPPWIQRFLLITCLLPLSHSKAPAGQSYLHHPPDPLPGQRHLYTKISPKDSATSLCKVWPRCSAHPLQRHLPHGGALCQAAAEQHFSRMPLQRGVRASLVPCSPRTDLWMNQGCSAPSIQLHCSL